MNAPDLVFFPGLATL